MNQLFLFSKKVHQISNQPMLLIYFVLTTSGNSHAVKNTCKYGNMSIQSSYINVFLYTIKTILFAYFRKCT